MDPQAIGTDPTVQHHITALGKLLPTPIIPQDMRSGYRNLRIEQPLLILATCITTERPHAGEISGIDDHELWYALLDDAKPLLQPLADEGKAMISLDVVLATAGGSWDGNSPYPSEGYAFLSRKRLEGELILQPSFIKLPNVREIVPQREKKIGFCGMTGSSGYGLSIDEISREAYRLLTTPLG